MSFLSLPGGWVYSAGEYHTYSHGESEPEASDVRWGELPNGMAKTPLPSRGFQGSILRRKVNVRILLKSQNLQGAMHLGLTSPCTPKHFAELI